MQDRVPLHPGRVTITPVSGQENTYDMELADSPTVTGTPLNKATLLTDATSEEIHSALPSISAPETVNEALNALASINQVVFDDAYTSHGIARFPATALSVARTHLAGASVGNYALFAGGSVSSATYSSVVDAYNTSLVRSTPTALRTVRGYLAGASVGNYALFAGGYISSRPYYSSVVDAYNASLVRSTPTALSVARQYLAGASVGNYALFAGGDINNASSSRSPTVDAYNASLVRSTPTDLSVARTYLAGANNGSYALFAGGNSRNGASSVVDAYSTSLVRSTPTSLSTARSYLAGAKSGSYALFAGVGSNDTLHTVDAYDTSLVQSSPTDLSVARGSLAGASVGNYALFAGGSNSNVSPAYRAETDAYGEGYILEITVPAFSKYKFDGIHSEEQLALEDTEVYYASATPFSGYMKRGFTLSGNFMT